MSDPVDPIQDRESSLAGRTFGSGGDGLRLIPAAHCARFSLRINVTHLTEAATGLGSQLPATINTSSIGDKTALCLGPDEWYLLAPEPGVNALVKSFEQACAKQHYSLVDVSHRNVGIELAGPRAGRVLASGCPLDLEAMADGACTRTVFDRAEIIMIKYTSEHYRLEIARSFAPFVWDFLVAIAREPS